MVPESQVDVDSPPVIGLRICNPALATQCMRFVFVAGGHHVEPQPFVAKHHGEELALVIYAMPVMLAPGRKQIIPSSSHDYTGVDDIFFGASRRGVVRPAFRRDGFIEERRLQVVVETLRWHPAV